MNDFAPPPLRAVAGAPRARRRGRWIGDVLLVSLGLHLILLVFVLVAPTPPVPPSELGAPSVEIVMGEGAETAATTATPEREAGVGVAAAMPSDFSPPPGPVEPPPKPEPSAPPMPPESPPTPPPPAPPLPAPSTPEVVRLEPPSQAPTTELLPLPPAVPVPEPPPPLPPLPARAPRAPAPAPSNSALRQLAAPRAATAEPRFPRPAFSFGGGLGTPSTSGTSRQRAYADLPAGSAPLGIINPAPGIAISGDNLGPDWSSLMRAWWEQHKYYPREAAEQGQDGAVTVTIRMAPDGRVRAVEMASRSGSQWLDMGALAIFRGQKLPPFPWNEARKEAVMNMQIQYILLR